jgi:hypothetical protein
MVLAGQSGRAVARTVHFRPVDTNMLLNNLAREVAQWPSLTWFTLLARLGVFRPYCAPHVVLEVEEKLDRFMSRRGRDPERAWEIWRSEYLPVLGVVDVQDLSFPDDRLSTLYGRDQDDHPTGVLAVLLGQRALSEDPDLSDLGLGSGKAWLDLIFAAGHIAWGETIDFGVGFGINVSAEAMMASGRVVRGAWQTPNGRQVLIAIGFALAALIVATLVLRELHAPSRKWIDETVKTGARTVLNRGQFVIGGYAEASLNRHQGTLKLNAAVVREAFTPSLIQRVARVLAAEDKAIDEDAVALAVWRGHPPRGAAMAVRRVLQSHRAFVEIEPGQWQIGRADKPGMSA